MARKSNSSNSERKKPVKKQPQRRRPIEDKPIQEPSAQIIDENTKRDIAGVFFIVFAVVFMLIAILPSNDALVSDAAGTWLHLIFGIGCYILPFVLAAIGITFIYRSHRQRLQARAAIGLSIIFISILGFISLFTPITTLGEESTDLLFLDNMLINYGGYIGAGIAWVGLTLFGRIVTGVILVGLIIIGILIVGFSISRFLEMVKEKKREYDERVANSDLSDSFSGHFLRKRHRSEPSARIHQNETPEYDLDDLIEDPYSYTRPLVPRNQSTDSSQVMTRRLNVLGYGDESRGPVPFVSPFNNDVEGLSRNIKEGRTIPLRPLPNLVKAQYNEIIEVEEEEDPSDVVGESEPEKSDVEHAEHGHEMRPIDLLVEKQLISEDGELISLPVIDDSSIDLSGLAREGGNEPTGDKRAEEYLENALKAHDESSTIVVDGHDEGPSGSKAADTISLDSDAGKDAEDDQPVKPDSDIDLSVDLDDLDEPVSIGRGVNLDNLPEIFPSKDAKPARKRSSVRRSGDEDGSNGYKLPPMDLLKRNITRSLGKNSDKELEEVAQRLQDTLSDFGVKAEVVGWIAGPTVTLFKVDLPSGVRVSRITALNDDIALALAAPGVRIFAPIPGTNHVGIEVPNAKRETVFLREVIDDAPAGKLQVAIGKDVEGNSIISDLAEMPHVLIAGTTGSGKSVEVNGMIMSILMRSTPDEVRFIMIDPKRVEFAPYDGIPHLYVPVVTECKEASSALSWAVAEMERRLKLFSQTGVRNIVSFNEKAKEAKKKEEEAIAYGKESPENPYGDPIPYIVIVIDELADLMMNVGKEVEFSISRIAQLARAAGIHLIIATQRPSTNVVTGLIKANITCRIGLTVASGIDSRVILDTTGAEDLIGNGDLLFAKPEYPRPIRVQGPYVSDDEINAVVKHIKAQASPEYHSEILKTNVMSIGDTNTYGEYSSDDDPLVWQAAEIVVSSKIGSTSNIQRRLKVGYARAGRIMDQLEEKGIVGAANGTKPREVLVDEMELESLRAFEAGDEL